MSIETKFFGGRITETKIEDRNGVKVGIVVWYIATCVIDRGQYGVRDQFVRGAFVESINDHMSKGRMIRLKDHHGRTVGGFPIEKVHEDNIGLFGVGEVNLEVQQGRELMALLRQRALSDFSIGFGVVEKTETDGLRIITKAVIWEGSVVDEPMNPQAIVTEVKEFNDLPLADKDYEWDHKAALARVREFTRSIDAPSDTYRKAFLDFDRSHPDVFESYSDDSLIADVVDGKLVAVRKALFKAADCGYSIRHFERYYDKMQMASPFDADQRKYYTADDVKDWTTRDIERALRQSGSFSKSAAKLIAAKVKNIDKSAKLMDNNQDILDELKSIQKLFK